MHRTIVLTSAVLASACNSSGDSRDGGFDAAPADVALVTDAMPDALVATPTAVVIDFASSDFYAVPFPSTHRTRADGSLDLTTFPNPARNAYAEAIRRIASDDTHGAGTMSGAFFALTGALDPTRLPDVHSTTRNDSPVFLVAVDGEDTSRRPVYVTYRDDALPFAPPRMLALLPVQGIPLAPATRYVAVVRRSLGDARGAPLGVPPALADLVAGRTPPGITATALDDHRAALARLTAFGIPMDDLAGITVFRTGDPTATMRRALETVLARPLPQPDSAFVRTDTFDNFCVYHSTVAMPDFQSGTAPYTTEGGGWILDANGAPVFQRNAPANVFVTVPRTAMPAAGYPLVVFVRTGGGGDRPLVDRGVQPATGAAALVPGTGPALEFARVGYAGASVDGPHGGLRNVTHADEQFLVFNVANPYALRDNVRESSLEIALFAHILPTVRVDVSDCPGASTPGNVQAFFDPNSFVLMGHSTGASIAPLAAAIEPAFHALMLSGSGGSYIENVLVKREPIPVLPLAESLLGYREPARPLRADDPVMSLLELGLEASDAPVYDRGIVRTPWTGGVRDVLMMQGIVDHYILPPIANASSLALGLDLAGAELDTMDARLAEFASLGSLIDLAGRGPIGLPAQGNVANGAHTAVVVQFRGDEIEDGHEVVFQTAAPKRAYRCFLASRLTGTARVPALATDAFAPCE